MGNRTASAHALPLPTITKKDFKSTKRTDFNRVIYDEKIMDIWKSDGEIRRLFMKASCFTQIERV